MLGHKYQSCIALLTIGYNVGPQISMLYTIINYWYNVGPHISMLYTIINYWV